MTELAALSIETTGLCSPETSAVHDGIPQKWISPSRKRDLHSTALSVKIV